jgi:hypothetical protein
MFLEYFKERGAVCLHHGDCIGADSLADDLAAELGYTIVIHPPVDDRKRAFCERRGVRMEHVAKPYLERNHDIVTACDILIAVPHTPHEEVRSGTWATVRYAQRHCKPIIMIFGNEVDDAKP